MKSLIVFTYVMTIGVSSSLLAQSRGEMVFTSASPNANPLIRKAWMAFADARFDEAHRYLRNVSNEDPTCALSHVPLYSDSREERADYLRKAESMQLSEDERLLINVIRAGLEGAPAEAYYAPLLKKYPKDRYLHLMVMYFLHGQNSEISIGENLVKRYPKFAPAYNLLGYAYMHNGQAPKAQAYFDKYLALLPNEANPYDSKGDFMMHMGRTEEAIPLYEKAASLGMDISAEKARKAKLIVKYPEPDESDRSTITGMINACFEAARRSDVDGMLKDFSPQSIDVMGDQRVHVGLPNVRQRFVNMFREGSFENLASDIKVVKGAGPIAFAYTQNDFTWKRSGSGEAIPRKNNSIYILRKDGAGDWKIVANHYYGDKEVAMPISDNDRIQIDHLLSQWESTMRSGEEAATVDGLSSLLSAQAVEIMPDQLSSIGLANIRARWAQFIGSNPEAAALNTIGVKGFGRRAVVWGVGSGSFFWKDPEDPQNDEFPWVMILTKEKDDAWRVLAVHWSK